MYEPQKNSKTLAAGEMALGADLKAGRGTTHRPNDTHNHAIVFRAVSGKNRVLRDTPSTGPVQNELPARETVQLSTRPRSTATEPTELLPRSKDGLRTVSLSFASSRDDLNQVVRGARKFAASILGGKGVRCEVTVQPNLENVSLSPEKCQRISLIFKEALDDITHHALSAALAIGISVTREELTVEIRDDGCGLFRGSSNKSGGRSADVLRRIQARIVEAGGTLELATVPGGGSLVTLTIPLPQE